MATGIGSYNTLRLELSVPPCTGIPSLSSPSARPALDREQPRRKAQTGRVTQNAITHHPHRPTSAAFLHSRSCLSLSTSDVATACPPTLRVAGLADRVLHSIKIISPVPPWRKMSSFLTCDLAGAVFRIGSSSSLALTTRLIDHVGTRANPTTRLPRSLLGYIRPRIFRRGRRRRRGIMGRGCPWLQDGCSCRWQEILLAHRLVRSFHMGLNEWEKPL